MKKYKITELNRLSTEEFIEHEKLPLVVVLDNVRSLHNVGSVFRTADAFLIESIYLCGITSTPPHAEIHKTALGAENSVSWRYFGQTSDAVHLLKENGFTVLSVEQAHGSTLLNNFEVSDKKYAIVLGNEVKGVQQEIVDMSDGCLEIPQFGTKHSLNVSVACGIAIWEIFGKMSLNK